MVDLTKKEELCNKLTNSLVLIKDNKELFSSVFKKTMKSLIEVDLEEAEEIINCMEGNINYNNFLTKNEACHILSNLINNDGSKGLQWKSYDEFINRLNNEGYSLDQKPYYNSYALWVTMNMLASDHNSIFNKWIKDNYFEFVYDLSVSKLIDKDKERWIRGYFEL